jgi:serine/threonine protein kinase
VTGDFVPTGATATFGTHPDRTADYPGRDERAGAVIGGKYTLVEAIGEGGMGAVWRAKQTDPVKRFVAVKLIKAGMDSKQVLARFEGERQAL